MIATELAFLKCTDTSPYLPWEWRYKLSKFAPYFPKFQRIYNLQKVPEHPEGVQEVRGTLRHIAIDWYIGLGFES